MAAKAERAPFAIGKELVAPGERRQVNLPMGTLSNRTPMALPVSVTHAKRDGPVLFVSAAVHGDELTGIAICRRLLATKALKINCGTLLVAPIVNAFGFISHSRYLPDRRDLNRSFPGSPKGSLASQLAHTFLTEVVMRSTCGIDLHSASLGRSNLPQIRIGADDLKARELAEAFGAPIVIPSALRDGSLRAVAGERGVPVLVYEAGEGLRIDEFSVAVGVQGVLHVLSHLGMLKRQQVDHPAPVIATASTWLRAPESGLFRPSKNIGDDVTEGEQIGIVADPFGEHEAPIISGFTGLIIGRTNIPAVNQGDALFHIAKVADAAALEARYQALEVDLPDEDQI